MDFCKKVLLLKESTFGFSSESKRLGGIVRIEYESGVSDLSVTLVNVKPLGGEYFLFLAFDKKTVFSFPLGIRPFSFSKRVDFLPSAKNGVSLGLIYVENNLPTQYYFPSGYYDDNDEKIKDKNVQKNMKSADFKVNLCR